MIGTGRRMIPAFFIFLIAAAPLGCDSGGSGDSGLAAPTSVVPRDGSTDNPNAVVLEWLVPPGAEMFDVQLASDREFTNIVVEENARPVASLTVKDLELGVPYHWRVRAHSAAETSEWSSSWSFSSASVAVVPLVPTLAFPAPDTDRMPLTVTLGWQASPGALSYEVQVSMEPGLDRKVADLPVKGTRQDIRQLVNGYTYWWRVRAVSAVGKSEWSQVWKFVCISE